METPRLTRKTLDDYPLPTLPSRIPLCARSLVVGRAETADIVLDSVRQPKMVSRQHALLVCDGLGEAEGDSGDEGGGRGTGDDGGEAGGGEGACHMRWRIEDLGAPNGTAVNGQVVVDSTRLSDGDVLRFGRVQSEVRYRLCIGR